MDLFPKEMEGTNWEIGPWLLGEGAGIFFK